MNLTIIKKNSNVSADNKVGTVLVGGSEVIDNGLGEQVVERTYWSKLDNSFEVGHVFTDVDLDKFHQESGDNGITFLTPVI